jgi:hypothetical protein
MKECRRRAGLGCGDGACGEIERQRGSIEVCRYWDLILQLYFARISRKGNGPGLKAALFCCFFMGLKAPAPSAKRRYNCSTKSLLERRLVRFNSALHSLGG